MKPMTNPYRAVEKIGTYLLHILFWVVVGGLSLGLPVLIGLDWGWGWWSLLLVLTVPVFGVVVFVLGAVSAGIVTAIEYKWKSLRESWDDKHRDR
jgi:hypothetical protein